jgi:hypothetical protein
MKTPFPAGELEELTRKVDLIGRLVTEQQSLLIQTIAYLLPQSPAGGAPVPRKRHLHAVDS